MASAALLVVTGFVSVVGVAAAPAAVADTAPAAGTPATVSADALPTVQANGIVWSQATVGNTVYATGSFTKARPAGSAVGVNETTRNNLLAYDITTGNLITSFAHGLNAQGIVASASPDGTRLYVGGDFTTVDGVSHVRIAAFNTATGALISTFSPNVNARVKAIAATNTTVYFGGSFTTVNGVTRNRVAAVSASNGALLNWAPSVDDYSVAAMVLSPSGHTLVIGGSFDSINGSPVTGLAALDPVSAAVLPWAATSSVQDSGANAGITSLRTDGTQIYGTGFVYGPGGNLEGSFAANPDTGVINWVEDCHGDSYDTFETGSVMYLVSHEHYCGNIGGFPQTNPWTFYRATAFTTYPTGTIAHNAIGGYFDWFGTPDPSQLNWYPTLATGTASGQSQAAWSATGNSSYLALGGEFPTVNGTAQQDLVRFAISSIAPNKVGPRPAATLTPNVVSLSSGTARVAWQTTFDQDNEALTYKVIRDGKTATPVYTTTVNSRFYNRPSIGFTDTGLAPGSTHTYRVFVYDAFGNSNSGSTVSVTIGSATTSTYATDVATDGATDFWRLGEASGTTGYDSVGFNDLLEQSAVGHGVAGAINGDSNTASSFDGSTNGSAATTSTIVGPDTFTAEAWFQTTSTSGGKILGFGDTATGTSASYDRHVYMDNAGHIIFGVYNNAVSTLSTSGTYNDGNWHQVVASLSPAGMVLYVDGKRIARNAAVTNGQAYSGYWRIGGDNLNGWPSQPTSNFFAGNIDDVAIYPTALSLTQVQQHYIDSGRSLTVTPVPTDKYGKAILADSPDIFWRLDDASGPIATDSSGNGTDGTYSGGVTYQAPSTVTTAATGVTLDGSSGLIVSNTQVNNPTVYSEEAWFNTTTTNGGKIIGFGDATSGESSNYDRHVYMLNTGQIDFGVWTGQTNLITSPNSYNDGKWHQVVATQGPDGMTLYVDGQAVGTNPQTQAQAYSGYWRVGGDHTWGGTNSDFFAGSVDEVAFYSSELSASRVLAHYQASSAAPAPANQPPVAAFISNCTNLSCTFDASTSADPDGTIASYAWTFGDGTTATGVNPTHVYTAAGPETVTLVVTDNLGLASSPVSQNISPTAANQPPVAAFTSNCTNLSCTFDASTSADPDGTIASYAWTFGDGTTATGVNPTHVYTAAGPETVTLDVTDNLGLASSPVSQNISPTAANQPPVAAFTSNCTNLSCTFDASTSADPDGTIASYAWTFGDGTTATGVNPTHVYTAAGPETVTLVVTDNLGLASSPVSHSVNPTAANQPPVAAFTASCLNLSCTFDASTSADPDGTIASYAWTFGDGTTATGVNPTHVYTAAGPETVTPRRHRQPRPRQRAVQPERQPDLADRDHPGEGCVQPHCGQRARNRRSGRRLDHDRHGREPLGHARGGFLPDADRGHRRHCLPGQRLGHQR